MTSKHLTTLPQPGTYAKAWRAIVALPACALVRSNDWTRGNVPAGQLRTEMRAALDRRINTRGGLASANVELDIGLVRDARRLDDIKRRIRVYQFESELCRKRFGHLLANRND